MLPYQQREEEIRAKNPTRSAIRYRQYLRYLNNHGRPFADHMIQHSANEVDEWRRSVSGGRTDLFAGMPVMGAGG